MRKKILFMLVLILCSTSVVLKAQKVPKHLIMQHRIVDNDTLYTYFIEASDIKSGKSAIEKHGGKVKSKIGKHIIAELNEKSLKNVLKDRSIKSISPSFLGELELDVSDGVVRATTGRLASDMTGEGVIIGIIDEYVNPKHPDFSNAENDTRILYYWDQTDNSGNGDPPPSFLTNGYGRIYTKAHIDGGIVPSPPEITKKEDRGREHGNWVTGIAAGSGRHTGNGIDEGTFMGMAPGADIVVVRAKSDKDDWGIGQESVLNGLKWISKIALDEGKPWVANLSIGWFNGPKNGTSFLETKVDEIINGIDGYKAGVVVKSAGNEKISRHHGSNRDLWGQAEQIKFEVSNTASGKDQLVWLELWSENNNYTESNEWAVFLQTPNKAMDYDESKLFLNGMCIDPNCPDEGEEIGSDGYVMINNGYYNTSYPDPYPDVQDHHIQMQIYNEGNIQNIKEGWWTLDVLYVGTPPEENNGAGNFEYNFEDGIFPWGWQNWADGSGEGWVVGYFLDGENNEVDAGYNSKCALYSKWWAVAPDEDPKPSDDWLVSPPIKIQTGAEISFYASNCTVFGNEYVEEKMSVYISDKGDFQSDFDGDPLITYNWDADHSNWVKFYFTTNPREDTDTEKYIDISSYIGNLMYLAIVCESGGVNNQYLIIDNLKGTGLPGTLKKEIADYPGNELPIGKLPRGIAGTASAPELTYSSNFKHGQIQTVNMTFHGNSYIPNGAKYKELTIYFPPSFFILECESFTNNGGANLVPGDERGRFNGLTWSASSSDYYIERDKTASATITFLLEGDAYDSGIMFSYRDSYGNNNSFYSYSNYDEKLGKRGTWDLYIAKIFGCAAKLEDSRTSLCSGKRTITEPGNAHNIITVGSMNSKNDWDDENGSSQPSTGNLFNPDNYTEGEKSLFSSIGPTRDINEREKPDLYAPGAWIASSSDLGTSGLLSGYWARDGVHLHQCGTSMSAPHVTGAVALLLQQGTYPDVKARLISTANEDNGYKRLHIWDALCKDNPDCRSNPGCPDCPSDVDKVNQNISKELKVEKSFGNIVLSEYYYIFILLGTLLLGVIVLKTRNNSIKRGER